MKKIVVNQKAICVFLFSRTWARGLAEEALYNPDTKVKTIFQLGQENACYSQVGEKLQLYRKYEIDVYLL